MAKKGKASAKAPSAKAAPQGPNLKLFYGLLALIALVGIAWIGMSVANRGEAAVAPIQLSGIEDAQALIAQAKGVEVGGGESAVQVLVFSDFTCPACRAFAQVVEPQLKAEYVETQKVRFVYYDFPLGTDAHRYGFIASRAARCAGDQSRFWEYHDLLFGRQDEWSYERSVPLDTFVEYAGLLGLDRSEFRSCLRSEEHADIVTANRILGERLGVGGTPTVFIGGRSVTNWQVYDVVKAAIEFELGGSGQ